MKWINTTIMLLLLVSEKGMNQPTYKAYLPNVEVDNFYCIDLPYEILGRASSNLSDIRIVSSNGNEVAWLLKEYKQSSYLNKFIPLPMKIISKSKQTDVLITTISQPISSFVLKIKNADVEKDAILLGSNDGKKWFMVKDRFLLNKENSLIQTEAFLDLSFPLSDYKLYKLSINDSLSAPLNIFEVGEIKTQSFYNQYLLNVPLKIISNKKTKKTTVIKLVLPYKYKVEQLDFYISSPHYYHRNLELSQPFGYSHAITLSNENGYPQSIPFGIYGDTLHLSIYNGDDQPLSIDSIKAYIRKYSLIALLEKGVNYILTYGDTLAVFPQYDLSFSNHLPDSIPPLRVGNIVQIAEKISIEKKENHQWILFFKTYGIWIIIILVILQILYIVKKLVK